MTGLEIEYFAQTSVPYASRAENLAAGEPADENKLVGLRNIKALTVHFLLLEFDILGQSLCYRVIGEYGPESFSVAVAPFKRAGCAHKALKRL